VKPQPFFRCLAYGLLVRKFTGAVLLADWSIGAQHLRAFIGVNNGLEDYVGANVNSGQNNPEHA
jgi:hypothetical protein